MTPSIAAEATAVNRDRIAGAEIWLRGNVRPALGLLAAALSVAGMVAALVGIARPPAWIAWAAVVTAALFVAAAVALAWSASRPRLARRGTFLDVRLSPLAVHHVPIDIVECVFPGSQSLEADRDDHEAAAGRRVSRGLPLFRRLDIAARRSVLHKGRLTVSSRRRRRRRRPVGQRPPTQR